MYRGRDPRLECPFCYREERLIFSKHFFRPINCEACLERTSPERYAEYLSKKRAREARAKAELALAAAQVVQEMQMKRGFCNWTPRRRVV